MISKWYKTYSDDLIANEEGEKKWRIGDSTDQEVTDHYGKDIWTYNDGIWNLNMHMFGEPSGVIKRDDNTQACDAGAAKGTKVSNKISLYGHAWDMAKISWWSFQNMINVLN